ncbi:hypothetical protein [Egicoccus sp. AB-alg6-2]|uniref:hypothetical protein n=1 Tax=Egicoccus sp. AB-alg6-2 TaxID=3242692 RepID=UPI00359EB984
MRFDRRDLVTTGLLVVLLSAAYLATANRGPAFVNDTRAATVAAWSVGTRGTAALPETWPASRNYWGIEGRHGHVYVNRFPGVAYWAAPAYAVADAVSAKPPPAHPFLVDPRPAAVTASVTAALAAGLLHLLLRTEAGRSTSIAGALVFALGTSLWSTAADSMWPHGPTCLALTALLLGWRRGWAPLAAAGAVVAVLVRPHLVVAVVVVAAYAWWREDRRDAVWIAAAAAVGLALMTAYTAWAFGTVLPVAGYDTTAHLRGLIRHSPWQTVRDLGLAFVSPHRGIFVFSPVVVPALVAVTVAWRRLPRWTLAAATAGLAYLVVQVRAVGYQGGTDFFAYRISLEPLLLSVPAMALAVQDAVERRRWLVGVVAVTAVASVAVHAYGAVDGGVSPDTVARWQQIDATVRRDFDDRRLGDVDLRMPAG